MSNCMTLNWTLHTISYHIYFFQNQFINLLVYFQSQGYAYCGHSSHVTRVRFLYDDSRIMSTGGKDTAILQWEIIAEWKTTAKLFCYLLLSSVITVMWNVAYWCTSYIHYTQIIVARRIVILLVIFTALQSQKAAPALLPREQILSFGFAQQFRWEHLMIAKYL